MHRFRLAIIAACCAYDTVPACSVWTVQLGCPCTAASSHAWHACWGPTAAAVLVSLATLLKESMRPAAFMVLPLRLGLLSFFSRLLAEASQRAGPAAQLLAADSHATNAQNSQNATNLSRESCCMHTDMVCCCAEWAEPLLQQDLLTSMSAE